MAVMATNTITHKQKLSCHSETAQCFVSLHISSHLDHSELEWHLVPSACTSDKGQNRRIGQVAPQPYIVQKSTITGKLPGPWTTTWSKQYLSVVHPVTCSLLWVRCLFVRLRQIFNFQIFWFRHPDYNPDRAQKLISSSMSRHLSTRKFHPNPCTCFWVILLTDRQTSRAIAYTSSFVSGKWNLWVWHV